MMDISERNFEETIEQAVLAHGYRRRAPADYDRAACLLPQDALDFILATQPKTWDRFSQLHRTGAKERLLKRLAQEIHQRGTLDVLRKGIKCDGAHFDMAAFRPVSGLNAELQQRYAANRFTAVRQLRYSLKNDNSLDMVIYLNGLPIFTVELKNPLTGQTVQEAIHQYRHDRDPKEPLFAFGRCLAHFAVAPDLVYVTTHLRGAETRFLPFNRGRNGGAGNPPAWQGFATAYLWEEMWAKDSVLNLIRHFLHVVEEEDDKGNKTGQRTLVFPRYHQMDAVRRLVADARQQGPGQRYLIQHSAGSGKSYSIGWLAHQLSTLHDAADRRVFDSVIIVTDRRVLDRQLQRTIRQLEQTAGVVENIDKTSRQLKQALEEGRAIIVSTLQKFPVIVNQMTALAGHRFAVIVDEAHSSQSGEDAAQLKAVLYQPEPTAQAAEDEEEGADDLNQRVLDEVRKRGQLPNVSYFAFTATPKSETMELFGAPQPDGSFAPFSLYTMRQAIEEGFILDVLEHYTTYQTYWSLLKKVADDPRYERQKATYLLKSFVEHHEHAIGKKTGIMLEHFVGRVMACIGGKAKAMIVTHSRLQAVRYKQAVDAYLQAQGYPFKALIAFSGTVDDGGQAYTEANMNGFPESQTAETFKRDEYRILIAANKFQTGFDQPLLHTMYVDKKLSGVNAVQTLSRLNRVHSGKTETMVLDFVNDADTIQKSFAPYYDRAILSEGTDPNRLYDLQYQTEAYHLHAQADVDHFAQAYFDPQATQDRLFATLRPVVDHYQEAHKNEQTGFRQTLTEYVRLYGFLSQILPFADPELEKLYQFGRLLVRVLPVPRDRLPVEIQAQIDMDAYRVQRTGSGRITLERGLASLSPTSRSITATAGGDVQEPLSAIIEELNHRFGTDFSADDRIFLEQLEAGINENPVLLDSVRINPRENVRLTFNHVVNDKLQDMMSSNFKFYKQITDDPDFARHLLDWLFDRYLDRQQAA